MTDGTGDGEAMWNETLRLLREEASSLVKTLPGPVANVSLRVGECAIEVSWADRALPAVPAGDAPEGAPDAAVASPPSPGPDIDDRVKEVLSPLVGTFYAAPEPGAAPFVRAGDRVEPGQPVGIVEAMKLMNHVTAEWTGVVVEVLAGDAEPVEFCQTLMRIEVEDT